MPRSKPNVGIVKFLKIQIPKHHILRNVDARGNVRFCEPNTTKGMTIANCKPLQLPIK